MTGEGHTEVMVDVDPGPEGHAAGLRCIFCGLRKHKGVAGETSNIFACDDCIALMVNIRRTGRNDETWPPSE